MFWHAKYPLLVFVCDKVKKLSVLSSGAIELSILSKHYQAEIAVVDTESGRVDRFGKTCNNLYHQCHSCVYYRKVSEVHVFPDCSKDCLHGRKIKCRPIKEMIHIILVIYIHGK